MSDDVIRSLGRTPQVAVIRVIEIRFLRGAGESEADPLREVVALFTEDGTPIVEIDLFAPDEPDKA